MAANSFTNAETDDQTVIDPIDISMGVLSFAQCSSRIPWSVKADPMQQIKRLYCRGSIPTIGMAGEPKISVDALKSFLVDGAATAAARARNGLPPETISPIFPMGPTFYEPSPLGWSAGNMLRRLTQLLELQMPTTLDQAKNMASAKGKSPDDTMINLAAEVTPEMRSAILLPLPAPSAILNVPSGAMFKNAGELHLAISLQGRVLDIMMMESQSDPQNIQLYGWNMFYDSPAAYNKLVAAAINYPKRGGVGLSKVFAASNYAGQNIMVGLSISDAQIMQAAGTNWDRVASLAF